VVGLITPNAFAENVPDWVKNTAGWWATDAISEAEFVNAITYLIKIGIIKIEKNFDFSYLDDWAETKISDPKLNKYGFRGADFSEADLSNSDLRLSDLSDADLSGADLDGAVLDNAILSNMILKCKNHPICWNE